MLYFKHRALLLELAFLRGKILKEDDKILFDEARRSLSKRAYRGAYILNWISAAESLRSKIAELALKDSEANQALKEIEKLEQQNQSPDKTILDKSLSLGILSKEEYKKLEHVRDMRNSYAHPTRVAPTLEELASAFNEVHTYVLSRPAQLKHGFVSNLVKSMAENRHYLGNDITKIREYAAEIALRIHPSAQPYLIEKVFESYDDSNDDVISPRLRAFATSALIAWNSDLTKEHWGIVALADRHPLVASLVLGVPELWSKLPEQARDMCFGYLVEPIGSVTGIILKPSQVRLSRLEALRDRGHLTTRQTEKMDAVLEGMSLSELSGAGRGLHQVIEKVIEGLSSHNWHIQNPTIAVLKDYGFEAIAEVTDDKQMELGRNVLQAAEGTSGSAMEYVSHNLKGKTLPDAFVIGLLKECFTNEQLVFRLKERHLKDIIEIVSHQEHSMVIFNAAIDDISQATPKWDFTRGEVTNIIGAINTVADFVDDTKSSQIREFGMRLAAEIPRLERLKAAAVTTEVN